MAVNQTVKITGLLVIISALFGGVLISWQFSKDWTSLYRGKEVIAKERWLVETAPLSFEITSSSLKGKCTKLQKIGGYNECNICFYPPDYYVKTKRVTKNTKLTVNTLSDSIQVIKIVPNSLHDNLTEIMTFSQTTNSELEFPNSYTVDLTSDSRNRLVWAVERLKQIRQPLGKSQLCEYSAKNIKISLLQECSRLDYAEVFATKIYFHFKPATGDQHLELLIVDPVDQLTLTLDNVSSDRYYEMFTSANITANSSVLQNICVDVDSAVNYSCGNNTVSFLYKVNKSVVTLPNISGELVPLNLTTVVRYQLLPNSTTANNYSYGGNGTVVLTYNKIPTDDVMILYAKYGYNGTAPLQQNITIPTSCFSAYSNKVQIMLSSSSEIGTADISPMANISCYNGGWLIIGNMSSASSVSGGGTTATSYNVTYDGDWSTGAYYVKTFGAVPALDGWKSAPSETFDYAAFYEQEAWFKDVNDPKSNTTIRLNITPYMDVDKITFNLSGEQSPTNLNLTLNNHSIGFKLYGALLGSNFYLNTSDAASSSIDASSTLNYLDYITLNRHQNITNMTLNITGVSNNRIYASNQEFNAEGLLGVTGEIINVSVNTQVDSFSFYAYPTSLSTAPAGYVWSTDCGVLNLSNNQTLALNRMNLTHQQTDWYNCNVSFLAQSNTNYLLFVNYTVNASVDYGRYLSIKMQSGGADKYNRGFAFGSGAGQNCNISAPLTTVAGSNYFCALTTKDLAFRVYSVGYPTNVSVYFGTNNTLMGNVTGLINSSYLLVFNNNLMREYPNYCNNYVCRIPVRFIFGDYGLVSTNLNITGTFNPITFNSTTLASYTQNDYLDLVMYSAASGNISLSDIKITGNSIQEINVTAHFDGNLTHPATSTNYKITQVYSKINKTFPLGVGEYEIYPYNANQKGVIPFGQTSEIPIYNFSLNNKTTRSTDVYIKLNESLNVCINISFANNSNMVNATLINLSAQKIISNITTQATRGIWSKVNLSCAGQGPVYFEPSFWTIPMCSDCVLTTDWETS